MTQCMMHCEVNLFDFSSPEGAGRSIFYKTLSFLHSESPTPVPMLTSRIPSLISFTAIFFLARGITGYQESGDFPSRPPPAIFVFGDSLSDTGNVMAAFPFLADAENPPYGSTFFGRPSGRYSDGRLIIDFMASRWGYPFVDPYFKNIIPNYRHGINFAVSGATARNVTEPIPFFLPFQTDQFIKFKGNVNYSLSTNNISDCLVSSIPELKSFREGIYMIFIGVNDLLNSFTLEGAPPSSVKEATVPEVVSAISKAVEDLHREGAMNFVVFNIPRVGCTPMLLSLFSQGPFNTTDELGCLKEYNSVVEFSNLQLEKELNNLSLRLEGVNITVVDIYNFMSDAIANPMNYGFEESKKFKACCGFGGDPYNFHPIIRCGVNSEAKACSDPDNYLSWDGLHFTEAFSKRFVEEMMKGFPYFKSAFNPLFE